MEENEFWLEDENILGDEGTVDSDFESLGGEFNAADFFNI